MDSHGSVPPTPPPASGVTSRPASGDVTRSQQAEPAALLPKIPECTVEADTYGIRVTHKATGDSELVETGVQALLAGSRLRILAAHRRANPTPTRPIPGFDVRAQQWAATWRGRLTSDQVEHLRPEEHPDYAFTFWATIDHDQDGRVLWTVTISTHVSEETLGHLCAVWQENVTKIVAAGERP